MVRFRIGAKLALGFGGLILVLLFNSLVGYLQIHSLQGQMNTLINQEFQLSTAAKDLTINVQALSQQLMAYSATRDVRQLPRIEANRKAIGEQLGRLTAEADRVPGLQPLVDKVSNFQTTFQNLTDRVLSAPDATEPQQLILMADNARNLGDTLSKAVEEISTMQQTRLQEHQAQVQAQVGRALAANLLLSAAGILLGVILSLTSHRSIAKPIMVLAKQMNEIAQGASDLTKRIHVKSRDELGELASSFNNMVEQLASMVGQIVRAGREISGLTAEMRASSTGVHEVVSHVSGSISNVAVGAQSQSDSLQSTTVTMSELQEAVSQIAAGAQQQAARSQMVSTLVNEMVETLTEVYQEATAISTASHATSQAANEGATIIGQTLERMTRLRTVVRDAAQSVEELGQSSRQIGAILQAVTGFAQQTNLLALNAAIEAARVGSAGKGFAVVAEEIRKLADGASQSVREITGLLGLIERNAVVAIAATRSGSDEADEGSKLATRAGEALQTILHRIEGADSAVQHITISTQTMVHSANEVSRAVMDMAAVIEENTAATEEMAAGADHVLSGVATVTSLAESNSSAAEEVAAGAEQTLTTVTHMVTRIDRLASVAEHLQFLVDRFTIGELDQ